MKSTPVGAIGAYADFYWVGTTPNDRENGYFSFGQKAEESDYDDYGVPDYDIFYYADLVEWDILKRGQNTGDDFMIIPETIEYVFKEEK